MTTRLFFTEALSTVLNLPAVSQNACQQLSHATSGTPPGCSQGGCSGFNQNGQFLSGSQSIKALSLYPQGRQSIITDVYHLQTNAVSMNGGCGGFTDFLGAWASNPVRGQWYPAGSYRIQCAVSLILPYTSVSGFVGSVFIDFSSYFWRPSTSAPVPFVSGGSGVGTNTPASVWHKRIGGPQVSGAASYTFDNVELATDYKSTDIDEYGYALLDGDIYVVEASFNLGNANNLQGTFMGGNFYYGGIKTKDGSNFGNAPSSITADKVDSMASFFELPFDLQFLTSETPPTNTLPVRGMYGLVSTL